jgi:hypothetical protein
VFGSSLVSLGLGLDLGLLRTTFLLGLLNSGLIIDRLGLGLLGSFFCPADFGKRNIFVVTGLLLDFALPSLFGGRSISLLLLLFLILSSLLATALLGRLLGGGVTTILGTLEHLIACTTICLGGGG